MVLSSTPLHKNAINLKVDEWPSAIALPSSRVNIRRSRKIKITKLKAHGLISSTPLSAKSNIQGLLNWPSPILKDDVKNTHSSTAKIKGNLNNEKAVTFLDDDQDLHLLRRSRKLSKTSFKKNQSKIETIMEKSIQEVTIR